ncbi:DUF952 domain-containing protein [Halomonas sp. HG01]|uniref:DUF952 domain-containing protein n=1 Tax=Halomonas sp. HG01 TaxID=1609967 RepID=UPI00061481F2|nr:DUF952 domain-containing protein [Halomonas sp. HG01]
MSILYRVLPSATWKEAKETGVVPRCGNDHKADGVNLNLPEAVEYTAHKYFTSDEDPVLLKVDTADFEDRIEWRPPLDHEPWQRPLARIDGIPLESVVSVKPVEPTILSK